MQSSSSFHNSSNADVDKFVDELPKAQFMNVWEFCKWEGYWFSPPLVKAAIIYRTSFGAQDDDVFLASSLKTGTTWLKALLFCVMQRPDHQTLDTTDHDALTIKNPHFLVPTVEAAAYMDKAAPFDLYDESAPRLLHTHLPHALLPDSVKNSTCKIVYVARNPKDTVTSSWNIQNSYLRPDQQPFPLGKFVDRFCSEHASLRAFRRTRGGVLGGEQEKTLLFLKYEELKHDPNSQVLKISEFLGRSFGDEEEGEVDEIVRRCSVERLKNLEVNKSESHA